MFMGLMFLNWWIVQNYTPGNPAPVLYIKNLAKDVIADDFYLIFGELSKLLPFKFCQYFSLAIWMLYYPKMKYNEFT